MLKMIAIGALTAVVCAATWNPGVAQTMPNTLAERSAFWKNIQKNCNATAAVAPSPLGVEIANLAKTEHARWVGHRIDHEGRLYVFGLVESENEERARPEGLVMRNIGWWNVWRYWSFLTSSGKNADPSDLRVTAIGGAIEETNPDKAITQRRAGSAPAGAATHTRFSIDTKSLLAAIDLIPTDALAKLARANPTPLAPDDFRQALKQSVLRAFISDNAWSAAFISYVVDNAKKGHNASEFRSGVAHRDYIQQAIETSKAEVTGKSAKTVYRACSIHGTTPRPGDLICYHREAACADANPKDIRDFIAFGTPIATKPQCKKISLTHCDVVTEAQLDQQKVYSIGGNVEQSVTERRLNIFKKPDGELVFDREQGKGACDYVPEDGMSQQAAEQKRCSLNQKDWFVLLQMRDTKGAATEIQQ
jgi:hypothetical protein